jgi:hypothetical protein
VNAITINYTNEDNWFNKAMETGKEKTSLGSFVFNLGPAD